MGKKLLLIGGGGHCRSVLDSVLAANAFEGIGIIDPDGSFALCFILSSGGQGRVRSYRLRSNVGSAPARSSDQPSRSARIAATRSGISRVGLSGNHGLTYSVAFMYLSQIWISRSVS